MRLTKLEWRNYRRIPDGEVTVRGHLILVGPNDSGKSSLLRALHLLLGTSNGQLNTAFKERDFTDPGGTLQLSVTLSDLTPEERVTFPDEIDLGPPETLRIEIDANIVAGDADSLAVVRHLPGAGRTRLKQLSRLQLGALRWAFVPATRSLIRELGTSGGSAVQSLLSEVDIGDDRTAIAEALDGLQQSLDDSMSLKSLRTALATSLSATLPRDLTQDDIHFRSENDLDGTLLRGVTITMVDDRDEAPLSEQSDGIRTLALLALLSRSRESVAILGVDEPEIHLHSLAQRSLGRELSAGDAQLCLATHSAALMGVCNPQDIVVMGSDRQTRQLPTTNPIGSSTDISRHWSSRLLEPLTARRIVLVEGPADRIILQGIARASGINTDRSGVCIFELDGVGFFATAYAFFGPAGFGLPVAGVVDEDARADVAAEVGVAAGDLEAAGIYVCTSDLEDHYVRGLGAPRVLELLATDGITDATVRKIQRLPPAVAISEADLAAFCRHAKRKVVCALAIANGLRMSDTTRLSDLKTLIET